MTPQEGAYARRTDPSTSHEAAESLEHLPALEALVVATLRTHSRGLTTFELAECTTIDRVTISPRLRPLVEKGIVIDSGEKRAGPSGRRSIVWKLKPVWKEDLFG